MSISKYFNGNIEISKLLKTMQIGQTLILEVSEGFTAQEAFNSVTASSVCRKKTPNSKQPKIDVQLEIMTAISGQAMDKLSKLLKVTKLKEYYI